MQSAAARGFTVVTLVTLVFTPLWRGHHWVDVLTGKTTETTVVKCQPDDPCPARICCSPARMRTRMCSFTAPRSKLPRRTFQPARNAWAS